MISVTSCNVEAIGEIKGAITDLMSLFAAHSHTHAYLDMMVYMWDKHMLLQDQPGRDKR